MKSRLRQPAFALFLALTSVAVQGATPFLHASARAWASETRLTFGVVTDIVFDEEPESGRHVHVSYATQEGERTAQFTLFGCPRATGRRYSVGDVVPVELNEREDAVWFGQAVWEGFEGRLSRVL